MSLLATVNAANAQQSYFIENIGGNGDQPNNPVPCIKTGDAFGAIRIADASGGMVLVGGGIGGAPLISGLRGGYNDTTNGSQVRLGSSVTSFQNIVLTDSITTINGTLNVPGGGDIVVGDDISLGGDLTFTNGQSAGASISGYYAATVAVAGAGAVANPAGLTAGVYLVVYAGSGAGNENAQPSGVFYWSGTAWVGNAVSFNFTAGAPNTAIGPVAGGATLNIGGASVPGAGSVFFRKVLN
jgi:hypothetical protein